MPFVDFPIECSSCRGSGKIKPVCAFRAHEDVMTIECFNCRGVGTIKNLVFVNPMPETKEIVSETPIMGEDGGNITFDELDEIVEKVKKVKSSKKQKLESLDAVR